MEAKNIIISINKICDVKSYYKDFMRQIWGTKPQIVAKISKMWQH